MKFQVGDKVIVQHSNEEGEIVEILDQKMVMVDVRGVRFPAYIDQLDFPYFKRFTQKATFPEKKSKKYIDQLPGEKKEQVTRIADGMWLSFLPVMESDEFGDEVVESLKIHLVNHTEQDYRFRYGVLYSGQREFELENELFRFQDFYLHDIPFENLNDIPVFEFDFSLQAPDKRKADHFETTLKLKAKQVFLKVEELRQKGHASFSYKLFDRYPDRVLEEEPEVRVSHAGGARIYNASNLRQNLEPARQEVDLHIEKLSDHWEQMDNLEILSIQLSAFEKWLDLAIAHRQASLIVIHGVGTGKLRDEIHEILRLRKEVKYFVNKYHSRYGYGATEIFFQYK